jgi:hypothetical protein
MKLLFLILSLAFTTATFAGKDMIVFPQVYNYGSSVQITIWNTTDRQISCSGSVWMSLQSGARETEYYFDYIGARFTSFRTIYPRTSGDRIVNVSHSISCF